MAETGVCFDLPTEECPEGVEAERAIQFHVTPTHYLLHPTESAPAAMSIAVTGSQPLSKGTVTLQSSDPMASPTIDPGYLSDVRDMQVLVSGIEMARKIAAQPGLAALIRDELLPGSKRQGTRQLERAIARYSLTLYHPVGTCRMGRDDSSVVDPSFRVRGTENLFVADASVFPSMTRSNPNATVMLVARRASKEIAKLL